MINAAEMLGLPDTAYGPPVEPADLQRGESDSLVGGLTVVLTNDHRYRGRALAVPGAYWSRARQAYAVDNPDARAAAAAIALFPEVLITTPQLQEIRDSAYKDSRPHDYATELDLSLGLDMLGNVKLYDWQDRDGAYLRAIMARDGGAYVGWDRGLGKTVISAAFIKALGAQRTLIAARNDAKEAVWYKQLLELLPDYDIIVVPDSTSPTKRAKALDVIARYQGEKLIVIIHYQAIRTIAGDKAVTHDDGTTSTSKGRGKGWDRLGDWDLMVYDESHRLASYNPNSSKNTVEGKALSYLRSHHVKLAVNLSGSGVMNRPDDLFGQLHFIYPHIYRAKWRDWNDRFVDYVKDGNRKIPIGWRIDKLPELRKELGVFMVYRHKTDPDLNLQLPPLIHQNIELHLNTDQRRVYEQVRDEFWASIEGGGIKANSAMDHLNKLRQIATAYEGVSSSKLDFAVSEIEEEPDEQFAVFTWYKKPGRLLAERLGDQAVVVDGDVSKRDRTANLRAHENGLVRVLIGSIATIGESLNLQYMHEGIRLDRHWNPEVNGQTLDRLYRQGQEARVTLRDLWAIDTVDTLRVKPNLASKASLRKAIFG